MASAAKRSAGIGLEASIASGEAADSDDAGHLRLLPPPSTDPPARSTRPSAAERPVKRRQLGHELAAEQRASSAAGRSE